MSLYLPEIIFSKTKDDLLQQIDHVTGKIAEFFAILPADKLLVGADPTGWPAVKNLKHITSVNNVMAFYIGLPSLILRLLGRPLHCDLAVEEMLPTNRPLVSDHGRYTTGKPIDAPALDALIQNYRKSGQKLKKSVSLKSEDELDSLKGLFGSMSLRLFAHFALKHSVHHSLVVKERIEK